MKKTTLLMLPLAVALMACNSPEQSQTAEETPETMLQEGQADQSDVPQATAMDVAPKRFKQLMEEKPEAIVLDVRTDVEVADGVIPGAQQMDFRSGEFKAQVKELDTSKPVLVYCAVGGRSGAAMEIMSKMGFTEVYNLQGGINKWKAEGHAVEPLSE